MRNNFTVQFPRIDLGENYKGLKQHEESKYSHQQNGIDTLIYNLDTLQTLVENALSELTLHYLIVLFFIKLPYIVYV